MAIQGAGLFLSGIALAIVLLLGVRRADPASASSRRWNHGGRQQLRASWELVGWRALAAQLIRPAPIATLTIPILLGRRGWQGMGNSPSKTCLPLAAQVWALAPSAQ